MIYRVGIDGHLVYNVDVFILGIIASLMSICVGIYGIYMSMNIRVRYKIINTNTTIKTNTNNSLMNIINNINTNTNINEIININNVNNDYGVNDEIYVNGDNINNISKEIINIDSDDIIDKKDIYTNYTSNNEDIANEKYNDKLDIICMNMNDNEYVCSDNISMYNIYEYSMKKDIVSHHKRGAIHGIMMIFFVAMGILISGINNMGIGVIYGINEVTFPRINNISIIILGVAIIITATTININNKFRYGWTMYPPVSTTNNVIMGIVRIGVSLLFAGVSSTLTAVNILVSSTMRTKIEITKINIYMGTMNIVNILLIIVLPSLTILLILLLADVNMNTSIFNVRKGGDCVLYQHLFWFFGHPEVYILILPCFACVNLEMCLRKHKILIHSVILIGYLGMMVWVHHMYTSNVSIDTRVFHNVTSVIIGAPSVMKISAINIIN